MKKTNYTEPASGVLTERMDIRSSEFKEFQKMLRERSENRTQLEKAIIELTSIKIQMEDYVHGNNSEIRLLGDFLKSFLDALNIRQNKFAEYIDIQPSNLNKMIKGEREITPETALKIGQVLGLDPLLLMEIQIKNEFNLILNTIHKPIDKYSLEGLITESIK